MIRLPAPASENLKNGGLYKESGKETDTGRITGSQVIVIPAVSVTGDSFKADIEAAARVAQVHDDICRCPDGYKTLVGERGVTLSGGQKQRIAIARALLQDAPILILDDALSAVDVKTEQSILSHLRDVRGGRTTLIVCHRVSAVKTAQNIIVLNHGEISEQGCHDDLLAKKGWYRQMYDYQQLEQAVEEGR